MKVVFGDLDEMLRELKEKEIFEIRVAALCDEIHSKEGVPFFKVYVAVQALLSPTLFAYYEQLVFKGIKPFKKEELRSLFEKNLQTKEELEERLREADFIIRAGHFQEAKL